MKQRTSAMSKVLEQIHTERSKLIDSYKITEQHFSIDDVVYYLDNYGSVVPARVTEIADFSCGGEIPGGCIYYWIEPEGCKLSWFNIIHSRITNILPYSVLHKLPTCMVYRIPSCFPGHAVTAGVDIFRTKQEADRALLLSDADYDLQMLIDRDVIDTEEIENESGKPPPEATYNQALSISDMGSAATK